MEQNNKFFVYDSYVFAFKNALAHARIFTLSYLVWLIGLIPIGILLFTIFKRIYHLAVVATPNLSKELVAALTQTRFLSTSIITTLAVILLAFLIGSWIYVGLVRITLSIHAAKAPSLSELFPSPWLIIKATISNIIFTLVLIIGLLCFILPGIYFMLRAVFFMYALVEGHGILESFSTSFYITRNKGWQIFSMSIISSALVKVTLFFSFPIIMLSSVYIYRLFKKEA